MKMTKQMCILLLPGLLVLGVGCAKEKTSRKEKVQEPVPVQVDTVNPSAFTEYVTYYGRLKAIREAHLVCYSGGRVEKLKVREGDRVKRGASLASIDSDKALSLLKTVRLQEKVAKRNLEQLRRHLEDGNASQLAVDKAELSYLSAKNSRIDAEKNYRGALAISPISGVVASRFIEPYQELPPGSPLFTVAQNGKMKISVELLESDMALIQKGGKTELSLDISPERIWKGKVQSIAQEASPESKKFKAEIHVDNADGFLKSGMTGRVRLKLREYQNAVVVPVHVVQNEGVRNSVMVVDDQGKARRRYLSLGPQTDSTVLVQTGLASGERFIVAGYHLVADGSPVVVDRNKSKRQDEN